MTVAALAWLVWREPPTWHRIVAILLTFAGTVLVSGPEPLGELSLSTAALLIGVLTLPTYSAYILFAKPLAGRYSPLTVSHLWVWIRSSAAAAVPVPHSSALAGT